ncbi:MAG: hypothetical protein QOC62_3801 [Mycobacterium sp.]|jgi:hypothetical protein|nr:hypothetical protein [Mycobacterium sp.]
MRAPVGGITYSVSRYLVSLSAAAIGKFRSPVPGAGDTVEHRGWI